MKLPITAVFIILLLSGLVFARIPIADIKGLDLTTKGYEDLNPLHGIPWSAGILENHGELLPREHPLRELIQILFHRAGTFVPSGRLVVPFLTPSVIGELLGAIKKGDTQFAIDVPQGSGSKQSVRTNRNLLQRLMLENAEDPRFYRVLLALLWAKVNKKEDFADYYRGVQKFLPKAVKEIPNDWSEEKFDKAQAEAPPTDKYDEFLFWAETQLYQAPEFQEQEQSYNRVGQFPDCGETSLRNFLKLALDQDGIYNVEILKSLNALPEVEKFFEDFPDRERQKDLTPHEPSKVRDAWADLTIGRAGVKYKNGTDRVGYEVTGGAESMFALLKVLLPDAKANAWEELGEAIEKARQRNGLGSFKITDVKLADDYGELSFYVDKMGEFKWHFAPGHFYIETLPAKGLGKFPGENAVDDLAIYFPPAFEGEKRYLYTRLREYEEVGQALLDTKATQSLDLKIGLLNRLTTSEARNIIFAEVVNKESLEEMAKRKDFQPSYDYLVSLLSKNKFEKAKLLVRHPWYHKDVEHYLIGHREEGSSAVFSPDGKHVLTASWDNTARIWDTKTGEQMMVFQKGKVVEGESNVISPNGEQVLTSSWEDGARIWDTKTGKQMIVLNGHTASVESAVFSLNGEQVLTASKDETARIWDAKTGEQMMVLNGHTQPINSAVFSPDGKHVLTASWDNTARIWDTKTGEQMMVLKGHTEQVSSAVFSPNGEHVLTASSDKTARIWNADTGKQMMLLNIPEGVLSAVFNPNGEQVLTATLDDTARIWNTKTGKEVLVLEGHLGPVHPAVFSPNGEWVLNAKADGTVEIWNAKTGEKVKVLKGHAARVNSAVFSPNGEQVLTVSNDKTARIWKIKPDAKQREE